MKKVLAYVGGVAAAAGLVAWLTWDPEKGARAFLTDLSPNLVAELLGIALGILLAVPIASLWARHKLKDVAPSLVDLLQQLRDDQKLSGRATRCAMVCAVNLIYEEGFDRLRGGPSAEATTPTPCAVCRLEAMADKTGGHLRCHYCKLPGHLWSLKNGRDVGA